MSVSRHFDMILVRPVISEKSYDAIGKMNKYTFRCPTDATKVEIKKAVEEAFGEQKGGITVISVNTIRVRGKVRNRTMRGRQKRITGRSPSWKKAVVTLAPGQKIEGLFAEGV